MKKTIFIITLLKYSQLFSATPLSHFEENQTSVIKENLEKHMEKLAAGGFSGVVVIDIGGKQILSKGYGFSDKERGVYNTLDTVFDIGSISKQFTASAVLKLQMQGKLHVKDKISKYFSAIPKDKQHITIHHLLTHSAGLPGFIGDDYEAITESSFIKESLNKNLLFKPGSAFEYSNVGYSLLTLIIEQVSEQSYEQYLYENLWKPANMETTGYTRPEFNQAKVAVGYLKGKAWGKPNEKKWASDAPFLHLKGNGGILSTAEDMYKWHLALLNEKILSENAKQSFYKKHIREGVNASSFYSYGWAVFPTSRNTELIAHNGSNGVFFADFLRYLDEKVTIIIMTNEADRLNERLTSQIASIIFNQEGGGENK